MTDGRLEGSKRNHTGRDRAQGPRVATGWEVFQALWLVYLMESSLAPFLRWENGGSRSQEQEMRDQEVDPGGPEPRNFMTT